MNSYQKELTDDEYQKVLDECYEEVKVCGYTYYAGYVLKNLDPIAFRCGKLDYESTLPYVCGVCDSEYDDMDDAEECCKRDHLCTLLEQAGYYGTDLSIEESLFEYGLLYNKSERISIVYSAELDKFDTVWIDESDVIDAVDNMKSDFFDFVGLTRAQYLDSRLINMIQELNQWCGWFIGQCTYQLTIDDLIERFSKEDC